MKMLRVPQREIRAGVELYGGLRREGRLYAPASGPTGGPGRLVDRLNDDSERFLALADDGPGCLVSKDRIVRIGLGSEEGDVELQGEVNEVRVRVEMAGSSAIEGVMPYTMPPDKARLLDFLNAAPRFVAVVLEDGLTLLNRDYVTAVTCLDENRPESS